MAKNADKDTAKAGQTTTGPEAQKLKKLVMLAAPADGQCCPTFLQHMEALLGSYDEPDVWIFVQKDFSSNFKSPQKATFHQLDCGLDLLEQVTHVLMLLHSYLFVTLRQEKDPIWFMKQALENPADHFQSGLLLGYKEEVDEAEVMIPQVAEKLLKEESNMRFGQHPTAGVNFSTHALKMANRTVTASQSVSPPSPAASSDDQQEEPAPADPDLAASALQVDPPAPEPEPEVEPEPEPTPDPEPPSGPGGGDDPEDEEAEEELVDEQVAAPPPAVSEEVQTQEGAGNGSFEGQVTQEELDAIQSLGSVELTDFHEQVIEEEPEVEVEPDVPILGTQDPDPGPVTQLHLVPPPATTVDVTLQLFEDNGDEGNEPPLVGVTVTLDGVVLYVTNESGLVIIPSLSIGRYEATVSNGAQEEVIDFTVTNCSVENTEWVLSMSSPTAVTDPSPAAGDPDSSDEEDDGGSTSAATGDPEPQDEGEPTSGEEQPAGPEEPAPITSCPSCNAPVGETDWQCGACGAETGYPAPTAPEGSEEEPEEAYAQEGSEKKDELKPYQCPSCKKTHEQKHMDETLGRCHGCGSRIMEVCPKCAVGYLNMAGICQNEKAKCGYNDNAPAPGWGKVPVNFIRTLAGKEPLTNKEARTGGNEVTKEELSKVPIKARVCRLGAAFMVAIHTPT